MPALLVIGMLFGGSLVYVVAESLGRMRVIGTSELSLRAYGEVLFGERYAARFWEGLLFSTWISAATTALSATLAVGAALLLRRRFIGRRLSSFLLQFSLPVPHLVAAVGMLYLLSQSGLAARVFAAAGLMDSPAQFPILVRDGYGIGIIIAYLWKEVPFVGLIVLATLQAAGSNYEDAARSLGAGRWQRFRRVTLPLIRPAVVSTSLIVFAFVFGTYEIPGVLGVRYPQALPVLAYQLFISPDLTDRTLGMALSVILAALAMGVVATTMRLERRRERSWSDGSASGRPARQVA